MGNFVSHGSHPARPLSRIGYEAPFCRRNPPVKYCPILPKRETGAKRGLSKDASCPATQVSLCDKFPPMCNQDPALWLRVTDHRPLLDRLGNLSESVLCVILQP